MTAIVFIVILAVLGLGLIVGSFFAKKSDYFGAFIGTLLAGLGALVFAAIILFTSTFYQNGVGEAKVIVNSVDKKIVGTVEEAGQGWKSPLDEFVDFDLFSQQLTYAGTGAEGSAPTYTGGTVNGAQITANVGGVDGGSTRAEIDLVATYSLSTKNITDIYSEFRSQERFTEQIISKQLLSIARQVPAEYTAIDFRGTKRGEAETKIREQLNEKLKEYGVEFTTVTIQAVSYLPQVEEALIQIEQANQAAQTAEAEQRTRSVEAETAKIVAQGKADAEIEKARGEAEANRLLSESVTPAIIELRRIEALATAAEKGQLIIDGGDGNLLLQPTK